MRYIYANKVVNFVKNVNDEQAFRKKKLYHPQFWRHGIKKKHQQAKIGSVLNLLLRSKATKSITMVATCRNMATIKDWYVSQKHFHEKKISKTNFF